LFASLKGRGGFWKKIGRNKWKKLRTLEGKGFGGLFFFLIQNPPHLG